MIWGYSRQYKSFPWLLPFRDKGKGHAICVPFFPFQNVMTAWSHSSTTAVVCQLFCNPATSKIIMSAHSLFVLLWDFDLFACSTHSLLALDHVWVIPATMLDRLHGQAASCFLQEWFIKRISRCGATFQLDFSFISPKSFVLSLPLPHFHAGCSAGFMCHFSH